MGDRARKLASEAKNGNLLALQSMPKDCDQMTKPTPTTDLQKLLAGDTRRIFERLGGVETPMMEGDNLSVLLASYFEDPDDETDDETGWGETALKGMEEVLEAIRAHFQPLAARVLELEAENKRLREGLVHIDALEIDWTKGVDENLERAKSIARAALKGGEI